MKLNSKSQRLHVDETYDADQTLTVRENDETEKSKSQNTLMEKNHRKISDSTSTRVPKSVGFPASKIPGCLEPYVMPETLDTAMEYSMKT